MTLPQDQPVDGRSSLSSSTLLSPRVASPVLDHREKRRWFAEVVECLFVGDFLFDIFSTIARESYKLASWVRSVSDHVR
ncbi:hypothetical protein RJT34_01322 [Clitoria ternatea]|uniref:Uncharacterized protein n=1 Tax=Clitoria ternatea TaxID=43366 RepID=A0AAN9PZS6_CLITE